MEYEIFFIINSLGIALIVLIGLYHLIGVKDEGNKED